MFKENTAYVILALIAIVLIGVTIGLQIVILSDQPESVVVPDDGPRLQSESLSGQLQNGQSQGGSGLENTQTINSESAAASVNSGDAGSEQVALALASPTETPEVIVLEPTAVPPTATPLPTSTPLPTATPIPVEPTSTPLPTAIPTTLPEVEEAPVEEANNAAETDASAEVDTNTEADAVDATGENASESTNTNDEGVAGETTLQPTLEPTLEPTESPTDTPVAPLPTPTTRADILMGILDRGQNCTAMTQVATQVMQDRLGVSVDVIAYSNPIDMIEALAQQSIDITLCYKDPDDRQIMREFLGDIRQVGSQHMVGDGYKLQLWANDGAKANIREQTPCVLDFLEKIDFTELGVDSGDIESFVQANGAAIAQWLECPYQATDS